MNKKVNVYAIRPISGVSQIVRGRLNGVMMSTEDIFKCLCYKAEVTEVIGDKLIKLNFDNYDKNNNPVKEDPVVIPNKAKPVTVNIPVPPVKETKPEVVKEEVPETKTVVIEDNKVEDTITYTTEDTVDEVVAPAEEVVEETLVQETTDEVVEVLPDAEDATTTEDSSETTDSDNKSDKHTVVVTNRKKKR